MTAVHDLTDRVVVVTGGSRGLGKEMCLAFAERGARLVIASRKLEPCQELAAQIAEQAGAEAIGLALHVGRWDECEPFVEHVVTEMGGIDVLVNNAGSSPPYGTQTDVSEGLFDAVVGVNMKGPFRLSALVGEHMVSTGRRGSIINVSSVAAVQPSAGEVPYAMAKAGLNTMTVALARVYAPNVRVNGIMPGAFFTDISKAWDLEAFERRAAKEIALERGGEPHEIVGAALYLASDASSYTTGTVLKVDGGMTWATG